MPRIIKHGRAEAEVHVSRIETSDAALVEMARAGDSTAFDALMLRFQRAAHAVAFSVVSDREAALDVLQESFIAAYRGLHTLDDPSRFGPWVCGIARNQAKQYRRARARLMARESPLPRSDLVAQAAPGAGTEQVREALAALTELQAGIVTLFYMEGYSIGECSSLLGVPEGTVKRRLHDARQRLKKEMTDMIRKRLPEFALPEDHRVVIEKATPIHTTRPSVVYFRDRWVLLWQDGVPWEPYDGPFWFWISESADGKAWSEPRRLDLPKGPDDMRYHPDYLQLMNACVVGDRLVFLTQQFSGHMDLYSSEDTVNWTIHPRLRMGMTSRGSLFSSGGDLYLVYPSVLFAFGLGNRVDLIRSSDGGFSWTWLDSPCWSQGRVWDAAGAVLGGRICVLWREVTNSSWMARTLGYRPAPVWQHSDDMTDDSVPAGTVVQRVHVNWSDDGGQTWTYRVWHPQDYPAGSGLKLDERADWPDPPVIEQLDAPKPHFAGAMKLAASGDKLVVAETIRDDDYKGEVWLAISRDSGKTWTEKAIYSAGALCDADIAFAPDGMLMLAGSSRTGDQARPWVVNSRIER